MSSHIFIFEPGRWIGEGRIKFSASSEVLHFYTRWTIDKATDQGIMCIQEIEGRGTDPNLCNVYVFSHITVDRFQTILENDRLGKIEGKGLMDAKTIAWEFHNTVGLEGMEVYELQENGDYMFHAEYTSTDQFRTIIDGRIWQKSIK